VTTGWTPTCDHEADPVPAVVLDPFAGSGTVGQVAREHGRDYLLVELNPEYVEQIKERLAMVQPPLLTEVAT
ncbi:MAG TPA: DNA methyltransferase, partial [Phycisphaerae bacterium]|nr:DNA methyltransferase [Phycisphaerae bacterium]